MNIKNLDTVISGQVWEANDGVTYLIIAPSKGHSNEALKDRCIGVRYVYNTALDSFEPDPFDIHTVKCCDLTKYLGVTNNINIENHILDLILHNVINLENICKYEEMVGYNQPVAFPPMQIPQQLMGVPPLFNLGALPPWQQMKSTTMMPVDRNNAYNHSVDLANRVEHDLICRLQAMSTNEPSKMDVGEELTAKQAAAKSGCGHCNCKDDNNHNVVSDKHNVNTTDTKGTELEDETLEEKIEPSEVTDAESKEDPKGHTGVQYEWGSLAYNVKKNLCKELKDIPTNIACEKFGLTQEQWEAEVVKYTSNTDNTNKNTGNTKADFASMKKINLPNDWKETCKNARSSQAMCDLYLTIFGSISTDSIAKWYNCEKKSMMKRLSYFRSHIKNMDRSNSAENPAKISNVETAVSMITGNMKPIPMKK